ncbi:IclR family transcriptional regulator [Phaeovulum sp.]|uniref:IclR family transcriptional regulator n=1 Tax=Phaeovulum sp. TaxID=2934796 RepID=UPI00356AB61F
MEYTMDGSGDEASVDQQPGTRHGIQVIARAADVLRALKQDTTGLSLGQIAERVNLPRSTVQRIVAALQEERLVIASARGGGLRLGPELRALGEATRYNIIEDCRPILMEISAATGETVDLSVLREKRMIFLDQIPGKHRLRAVSAVGEAFPLTLNSNGRACLSLLPEATARTLIADEWKRSGTKGDLDAFMVTLARYRERGIAEDVDEQSEGISALGIAFSDWSKELYSISVPAPTTRFIRKKETIIAALTHAKSQIEAMLTE